MANGEISIRQWQNNYKNGLYNNPNRQTMCDAGWYDWFCNDSSLKGRLDKMAKIIMKIQDGGRVDLDNYYVWFKNNCPLAYPLYDDFRIADRETGRNVFVVEMISEFTKQTQKANYVIFGVENNYHEPLFKCNDAREVVKWLNGQI